MLVEIPILYRGHSAAHPVASAGFAEEEDSSVRQSGGVPQKDNAVWEKL